MLKLTTFVLAVVAYVTGNPINVVRSPGDLSSPYTTWANGKIPYAINKKYTSSEVALIKEAIAKVEEGSGHCITFNEVNITHAFFKLHITPFEDDGRSVPYCYSYPGIYKKFQGKRKEQRLAVLQGEHGCLQDLHSIMKFISIATGLTVENRRIDRDQFIHVFPGNHEAIHAPMYSKYQPGEQQLSGEYDLCSITHAQQHDGAKPGMVSFNVTVAPFYVPKLAMLSAQNCQMLSKLYKCEAKNCPATAKCSELAPPHPEEPTTVHHDEPTTTHTPETTKPPAVVTRPVPATKPTPAEHHDESTTAHPDSPAHTDEHTSEHYTIEHHDESTTAHPDPHAHTDEHTSEHYTIEHHDESTTAHPDAHPTEHHDEPTTAHPDVVTRPVGSTINPDHHEDLTTDPGHHETIAHITAPATVEPTTRTTRQPDPETTTPVVTRPGGITVNPEHDEHTTEHHDEPTTAHPDVVTRPVGSTINPDQHHDEPTTAHPDVVTRPVGSTINPDHHEELTTDPGHHETIVHITPPATVEPTTRTTRQPDPEEEHPEEDHTEEPTTHHHEEETTHHEEPTTEETRYWEDTTHAGDHETPTIAHTEPPVDHTTEPHTAEPEPVTEESHTEETTTEITTEETSPAGDRAATKPKSKPKA